MNTNGLCEKLLEAIYIRKNFIDNEPRCNYEIILNELINYSSYFMKITGDKKFQLNEDQSNGECDAEAWNYSLDFKMLAMKSLFTALMETSYSVKKIGDGVVAFGIPRKPGTEYKALNLVPVLRDYSIGDLYKLENEKIKNNEGAELSIVLKSLRTKKNILMLYPYKLFFEKTTSFYEGCIYIQEVFNNDFNTIRLYRNNKVHDCETYLSCFYEGMLIIFKDDGKCWDLIDYIEIKKSETYQYLFYKYGNRGFN